MAVFEAVSRTQQPIQLSADDVTAFAGHLNGALLRPGDRGYDEARHVWNGLIDRCPALIARCADVSDVIEAVRFARAHDMLTAVRGGGHNVAGTGTVDGGLLIDLSLMKRIRVDPERRTARAEGGVTWGELDRETQVFGLATPGGVVTDTGVAGLTLGGGFGWLRRKHGLSADNLLSIELVTASGQVVRASDDENPELFWALRGGGGNFGVVTAFEFRLHPVGPEVMQAIVLYPLEIARPALQFYREQMEHAPDDLSSFAIVQYVPAMEPYPEAWHHQPTVIFAACYSGPLDEGERVVQPLREFAEPIIDLSGRMPYLEVQQMFDEDYPRGRRYYWKSTYLDNLSDPVIDRLIAQIEAAPSYHSTLDVWHMGGAVARPAADTAFRGRQAPYHLGIEANWENPADDEANIAWAREVHRDLQRFSDGSQYMNFPGFLEDRERVLRQTFGDAYDRLARVKAQYDPDNFFRLNANIPPAN
ncbi:MAG: FAD-binding oxidoreductase [Chloroflexi bacterium]|nr:FAD-binding oxidoreductase [Chloroflexota bacterium]